MTKITATTTPTTAQNPVPRSLLSSQRGRGSALATPPFSNSLVGSGSSLGLNVPPCGRSRVSVLPSAYTAPTPAITTSGRQSAHCLYTCKHGNFIASCSSNVVGRRHNAHVTANASASHAIAFCNDDWNTKLILCGTQYRLSINKSCNYLTLKILVLRYLIEAHLKCTHIKQ